MSVPCCMVIVKDENAWVISAYITPTSIGYGYHKLIAQLPTRDAFESPELMGKAVRAALDKFWLVKKRERGPKNPALDAIHKISSGKGWAFFKRAREVGVAQEPDSIKLEGAFASGNSGFLNLKGCTSAVPLDASDIDLGKAIVKLNRKIEKKVFC